jgi:SNF2 family DNA or RNA helicase
MVVAPLSAYEAWETEAQRCFDEPPLIHRFSDRIPHGQEVVLVNYQRLANYLPSLAAWLHDGRSHLILDEAHRMKRGRDGQWGSACLDLAHLARRRDILTGTPAPQGPRDFIALVDFVWPDQARGILPAAALRSDPPMETMADVSDAIRSLFVRTTKSELGLDAPLLHVEPVPMKPLQTAIYEALRNRYVGLLDISRTDQSMLAQMGEVTMYLLEAATNPALLARRVGGEDPVALRYPTLAIVPGSQLSDLIARYGDHELPRKFEKLAALIDANTAGGRKTLVWSNFVGNLLYLERMLARYRPALIYGAIPNEEAESGVRTRPGELDRFRNDDRCTVLLANPAAMAEGVSLHETCHDAVYLERTFNAGQYLQSLDRIHRLGLASGVETNITFLVSVGSIDEAVDGRVGLKSERLAAMLDDPDLVAMALPDDDDYGEIIEDIGDLQALFEHLGETD